MTYCNGKSVKIGSLVGLIFTRIENKGEELRLTTNDGRTFVMSHSQSCCEDVRVEDVEGELDDLTNTPVVVAEERTQDNPEEERGEGTWTFYVLRTMKGSVTIRWYGSSNGYYSVGVELMELPKEESNEDSCDIDDSIN